METSETIKYIPVWFFLYPQVLGNFNSTLFPGGKITLYSKYGYLKELSDSFCGAQFQIKNLF